MLNLETRGKSSPGHLNGAGRSKVPQPVIVSVAPLASIIREGRTVISPDLAARILRETNYERQRSLKAFRLHGHVTRIRRGQWDGDCSIRFAMLDGRLILVDGQHRLNAIISTGQPCPIMVVISSAATVGDVHTMYSRIDADGNRSMADVLAAADPTEGRDISHEMRRNAAHAMPNLADDFPHTKLLPHERELVSKEDRTVCMAFWLDELEAYDLIVRSGNSKLRKPLRQQGVISVALATLKYQREKAVRFWTAVSENNLLKSGDPEQALVTFLLTSRKKDGFKVTERGCARAWNSWLAGRKLSEVKRSDAFGPIKISGTPFQGRAD